VLQSVADSSSLPNDRKTTVSSVWLRVGASVLRSGPATLMHKHTLVQYWEGATWRADIWFQDWTKSCHKPPVQKRIGFLRIQSYRLPATTNCFFSTRIVTEREEMKEVMFRIWNRKDKVKKMARMWWQRSRKKTWRRIRRGEEKGRRKRAGQDDKRL